MTDDLLHALQSLAARLVDMASRDDGLRDDLRTLASALLSATDRPEAPSEPEAEPPSVEVSPPVAAPAAPLPELTLGRSAPALPPSPATEAGLASRSSEARSESRGTEEDLPEIELRCRLKAEGLRWAVARRRRIAEGVDFAVEIAPRDHEILDRARAANCFLWMNSPDFATPADPEVVEEAAGCFEAVAEAVALVRLLFPNLESNRRHLEPALDLLAEAQSALRGAVERFDSRKDSEQFAAYNWLRTVTAREQYYIQRFMRLDDPASPSGHPGIQARLKELRAEIEQARQRGKTRKALLSKLRYHARRLDQKQGDDYDWEKIVESLEALVAGGEPTSSVDVRDCLLPILEEMPDLGEPSRQVQRVFREIDRFLATRRPTADPVPPEPPTAEVVETAKLLEGKSVVLIGGACRTESHAALKRAFKLKELIWVETREHESIDHFEPSVARPDVVLVILAIRWSSHAFGDVKAFCDRYDKPLLRLPRGYSPNQVAREVLSQCSERLAPGD